MKLVLCAVVSAVERVAGDHVDRFEDRRQGGAQRGHVTVRLVDVARDGGAQPGQPCERLGLGVDLGAPGGDLVDVLAQASLLGLGGRDRLGVLGQVALVSLRSEFAVLVVAVGLRQRGARPRRFGRRALGLLAGEGDLRVELSPDRAARPLDVEHPALEHAQRRGVHVRARQARHRAGALPARSRSRRPRPRGRGHLFASGERGGHEGTDLTSVRGQHASSRGEWLASPLRSA